MSVQLAPFGASWRSFPYAAQSNGTESLFIWLNMNEENVSNKETPVLAKLNVSWNRLLDEAFDPALSQVKLEWPLGRSVSPARFVAAVDPFHPLENDDSVDGLQDDGSMNVLVHREFLSLCL